MRVIVSDDRRDVGREAARIVARQMLAKPDSVLGLPTGETPIGMYDELVKMHAHGLIELRQQPNTAGSTSRYSGSDRTGTSGSTSQARTGE